MLFTAASLALMVLDHRQHRLDDLRAVLLAVTYPLQVAVDLPVAAARWAADSLATRRRLQEENLRLRARNLLLEAQNQKLAALEAENQRLRELLHAARRVGERVLIAELLAVDLDPYRHRVVLNKGSRHGIRPGQPLVDAHGVMGQVVEVGPFSSVAMLISDPGHAIPVQVNRTGLRAIAYGTGSSDRLLLPHLPRTADVREGDLLVSSGLGERFPPGYPVGVIIQVRRDPGGAFTEAEARPAARLRRSREVLLVWTNTPAPATTPPAAGGKRNAVPDARP